MILLTVDPSNPDKIVLTATVSLYLDRLLSDVLSAEVASAVRETARRDIETNKIVRKSISDASHRLLLGLLGVPTVPPAAASGPSLAMGRAASPPVAGGNKEQP